MSHAMLPGQRLREARDLKGLSVDDVAQTLRMSTAYVKALESDDYERLPEAAFVKGYLRNYARLVGLPADDIANMFSQVIAEDISEGAGETSESEPPSPQQSWLLYVGVAVVVLLLCWFLFVPSADDATVEGSAGTTADALVSEAEAMVDDSAALTQSSDGQGMESDGETDSQAGAGVATTAADVAAEEAPVAVTATSAAATSTATATTTATDVLRAQFSDDCWVKVTDAAGEVVFTGQRNAQRALTVKGQSPFRITLGNAAAVASISVNDRSVSIPSATPGRVMTLRAE